MVCPFGICAMHSVALYARRLLRRTWCARVRLHRAAVDLRLADACMLRARVFSLRWGRQHEHAAKACEVTGGGAQWPPDLRGGAASSSTRQEHPPRAAGTAALLHAWRRADAGSVDGCSLLGSLRAARGFFRTRFRFPFGCFTCTCGCAV